ncbi:hypothetical protein SAMN05661010_02511 [Modicisalibacter muralis]|uniref:Uncharacterized protein n=1 Tax=Modicisalibacter muralis TaxID=119000 RepID=A0A1G9MTZ9_9GAMM|nr:hypothetical protein [Halomonas muralis]SDL77491.1 hypothetical protein SAMN05661010_02511 [Halomonas muralis]
MANIKIHAGDFAKQGATFSFGSFSFLEPDRIWKTVTYSARKDIDDIDIASEENVKRIGGTVGWGAAGAIVLGPVGLLAGLLAGGRKKDVIFAVRFKDGRKALCTVDSKTFTKIQAATF